MLKDCDDNVLDAAFAKLDPLALGVAFGIVCGFGVFLASAVLLLKGGSVVGPTLSLLGSYPFGFEVTWAGVFIGLFEGGLLGLGVGALAAGLWTWSLDVYARIVRWRSEVDRRRDPLDKV